ncbi:hypothetical protein JX265_006874 [Neoarthrinium moseri]|uniref:Uncharacterized protein n=1 Tax=Neoarthrinium moseri TaxID=1658444 RepID=A0A9Q0ALJ8_9PEZI|nr:hypothetical protein JX265_006874 [Neoarthrinium moseri]
MRSAVNLFAPLMLCASLTCGYKLKFFERTAAAELGSHASLQCEVNNHEVIAGPGDCVKDQYNLETAPSCLQVGSTGPVDDSFQVVWSSSDDCNPDNVLDHGDEARVSGGIFDS